MNAKRIAVLTSGGDAPGMNAAIRAVVRQGIYHNLEVVGVVRGYQGLINGKFKPLRIGSVAGIISRGGTVLKTARSEEFKTEQGFGKAISNLKQNNIDALIVIGGDGSMQGAQKISDAGIPTVVIPATIDKDMKGTEYTLGFDTALNTILEAVNKIRDTTFSHDRVAIIEVMGRQSGQLALMAGIACGAEAVLIPEVPFDLDKVSAGLIKSYKRGKQYSIIIVAEGAGKGADVAAQIAERTSFSPCVTVLGYIQRGGNPSATDNIFGSRMGSVAVASVLAGQTNCLTSVQAGKVVAIPYEQTSHERFLVDESLQELVHVLAT